jgi:Reverse transcriptase (RNA-dependent DNA polymerase)
MKVHDWQIEMMAHNNWSSRCMVSNSLHDVGTISNAYLVKEGFKRMGADPCIHSEEFQVDEKGVQKTQYQIVALYVDDLIIAGLNKYLLTTLEGVFESRFKMKKLNQIKQILGMGVHHDKDRNIIYVTQQQYIEESFKQYNKYGISVFSTPMDDRAQYSKSQMLKAGSAEALQVETFKYRELIGTLL